MKKIIITMTVAVLSLVALAQVSVGTLDSSKKPERLALKPINAKQTTPSVTTKKLVAKQVKAVADQSIYNGRKLYGSLIYGDFIFDNASSLDVAYGLYSFGIGDDVTSEPLVTSSEYDFQSGAYSHGKFFGISAMSVMGAFNGARYITIDTEARKEIKNIKYSPDLLGYGLIPSAMAYNPIDNIIYSIQYNSDLSGMDWCKYNAEYDCMDKICKFRGSYNVLTLAATPDGEMFFINGYGDLYHINKENARPSLIGFTGVSPYLYAQSMSYDSRTGKFIWAAQTEDGSVIYAVDPATAETQYIKKLSHSEQYVSIYSLENTAPDAAPAETEQLSVKYDENGGLSGFITVTAPASNYDGSTLTDANLNVWIDGAKVVNRSVSAGEKISIPVTFEEGNHYVSVNTNNKSGYSPLASLETYAGYDNPEKVSDLTFAVSEGNNIVKWIAPKKGINNGYVDYENISYTIVRMPDSVTVAKGLQQTEFVETTPAEMHGYSYRVYAVNNGKTSECAESENIVCGLAFSVPYEQNFADAKVFSEFFKTVDANNDNNTWRAGYNGDVRIDINTVNNPEGDDWLITPAIKMDKGNTYRFKMNMKTFMTGYPEDFEIYVGNDINDLTTFKQIAKEDAFELYEDFGDYSTLFNVEQEGNYYIGIRYVSKAANKGSMMMLKSVGVTKLGASKAPKQAEGIVVIPADDDEMKATISFKAPTTDLENNILTELTKIKVYRNAESNAVHVFDSPSVGETLTWTDEAVKVIGMNNYKIVAENAYGEGEQALASAFVGAYKSPYLETFDTRDAANLYKQEIIGVDLEKNPFYRWTYKSDTKQMSFYAFVSEENQEISAWLISPKFQLDADAVYELSYKTNINLYSKTITNKVYMGENPSSESMHEEVGEMPRITQYQMKETSHQIVTDAATKCYFGFNSLGTALYDYLSVDLDDIAINYLKSARSPYAITDYKSEVDQLGNLSATLSFRAPEVDYHKNALEENMTIEIYRGQSPMPVFTQSDVSPKTRIKWTDTQASKGTNAYMVVATNQYGRSEAYLDTVCVGRDIPVSVSNLTAKGTNGNLDAKLSWEAPSTGVNGGVIVANEMKYNIYSYDNTEATFTLLAKDVEATTYTVENKEIEGQDVYYYAVEPVNTEGSGEKAICIVALGKPFAIPFAESFANKEMTTNPWIINTTNFNVYSWGVTCPNGVYNNATPQDDDGGCAYMYNGNYYEIFAGAGFVSPKINLAGTKCKLTFWLYHFATKYTSSEAKVDVYLSANDEGYALAKSIVVGGDTEDGWVKHEIDLSKCSDSEYFNFAFLGFTLGYQDVIYLDNISVSSGTDGVDAVMKDNGSIPNAVYYDMQGRKISNPENGIYIMCGSDSNGNKIVKKVVKK